MEKKDSLRIQNNLYFWQKSYADLITHLYFLNHTLNKHVLRSFEMRNISDLKLLLLESVIVLYYSFKYVFLLESIQVSSFGISFYCVFHTLLSHYFSLVRQILNINNLADCRLSSNFNSGKINFLLFLSWIRLVVSFLLVYQNVTFSFPLSY